MVVVSYPNRVIQGANSVVVTSIQIEWRLYSGGSMLYRAQTLKGAVAGVPFDGPFLVSRSRR
jgi:hypothetical protein